MALQEEFDRIGSSTTFNGISLLRNTQPGTIQVMAGITGASESLLSLTTLNSHRFAGEVAITSDVDRDGRVTVADLSKMGKFLGRNYDQIGDAQISSSTILRGVDSSGANIEVNVMISRFTADFNKTVPLGPTPANLNFLGTAYRLGDDDTGSTSTSVGSSASSFTVSGTMTDGATFAIDLDLSDISYTTYENPSDNPYPTNIGFTNVASASTSKMALEAVKNRIKVVSGVQGELGAVSARLEIASNNLQVGRENFDAAASQIMDADIADEGALLIRNQILQKSASAVLAQANLQPRIVLDLL